MSRTSGSIVLSIAVAAMLAAPAVADAQPRQTLTPPRAISLCQPVAPGAGTPNDAARRVYEQLGFRVHCAFVEGEARLA